MEPSETILDTPPRMFRVEQGLDAVRIKLPRRVTADRSKHNLFIAVVGGAALLTTCGGVMSGLLMQLVGPASGWEAMLVPAAMMMLSLTPYVLLVVGHRRMSAAGEITLDQRMLRMVSRETVEVPLESVRDVTVVAETDRGHLLITTAEGEVVLFDGLFARELEWLAALLRQHTGRLRQRLAQEGHDVDAVPHPPQALVDLTRRR